MKRIFSALVVWVALVGVVGFAGWAGAAEPARIAADGRAGMAVVVSARASEGTKQAARTLADYLGKISGAAFAVETGEGQSGLVVGRAGDFAGISAPFDGKDELQREDYLLQSSGKRVLLIGASDKGVTHAVWDFLYRLGYRRFFPNPHWEIIPHEPNLSLAVDVHEHPDFFSRAIWSTGAAWTSPRWNDATAMKYRQALEAQWDQWNAANRMGGAIDVNSRHSWNMIVEAEKAEFAAHPEYFALVDGKRQVGAAHKKFCISNPGLRRVVVKYALDYFAANPEADSVSIEPSDLRGWCQCPKCAAIGGPSDLMAVLANEVVDAVRAKYPGKYVAFYAYNMHADPPKYKLHPGIIVPATTALTHGKVDSFQDRVAGWRDQGAMVGVRDYFSVWNWEYAVPHIARAAQVDTLPGVLAEYHRLGLRMISAESNHNWGPNGLGYYIASRLLWDGKEADRVDALVDDFVEKCFGMSAGPMKEFYGLLTGAYGTTVPPFDGEYLNRLWRLLDRAWKGTEDAGVRARLGDLAQYVHYLELYRRHQAITDPAQRQKDWENLVRYAERIYSTQMITSTQLVRFKFVSKGDRFEYEVPAEVNIGKTWKAYAAGWDANRPFSDAEIERMIAEGIANTHEAPLNWSVAPAPALKGSDAGGVLTFKQTGNSDNRVLLYSQSGGTVRITFVRVLGRQTVQSTDEEAYSWAIRDGQRRVIQMGDRMKRGQVVSFQAKANTPYYFYTVASARVRFEGAGAAVQTNLDRGKLHLFQSPSTLYVHVPAGVDRWTLGLDTMAPGETAKVTVLGPDGREAAVLETGGKSGHRSATLEGALGFWTVRVGKAGTGILYDYMLTLDKRLSPWASLDPGHPLVVR